MRQDQAVQKEIKKQQTVEKNVDKFYKANPGLINSDKDLLILYFQDCGLNLTGYQKMVFRKFCPPAESITRAARKLRAENNYELAKKVAAPVREKRYRKFLGFKRRDA